MAETYIINRLPTPVLDNKTPYELLYKISSSYDNFKVFGCLCYASIHENDKFHPRAVRCVFVGYPHGHKGYKLHNLDSKQIFIFRHVVFHETIFPFLNGTHENSSTDPYFLQNWINSTLHNNNHTMSSSDSSFDHSGLSGSFPDLSSIFPVSISSPQSQQSVQSQQSIQSQQFVNTNSQDQHSQNSGELDTWKVCHLILIL